LVNNLQGDDLPRNRRVAAYVLGTIGSPKAVSALIESMQEDAAWDVRLQSAYALNRIGTPEALTALAKAARQASKDTNLQFLAENPRYATTRDPDFIPGQVVQGFYEADADGVRPKV
jgi:HEAT repeat protein